MFCTDSLTLYVNKFSGEDKIITTTVSYCSNADPAIILSDGISSPAYGGNVEYLWQTRTSTSTYEDIDIPKLHL